MRLKSLLELLSKLRLNVKISLLGAGSVLLTATALVALAAWHSGQYHQLAQGEVDRFIEADLDHITQGVYNLVHMENEAVQKQINNYLNVAQWVLESTGGLSLSRETVHWTATNQVTGEALNVDLPKMLVGGRWLGMHTEPSVRIPFVDDISRLVGETVTLFQRMNEDGDMMRVATSVMTADGQRAIGTYIPARILDGTPNPVIAAVMSGSRFTGRAFVVDAWNITAYEPIADRNGRLLGMLFVGMKQSRVENRVRQAILQTKVGQTGYVYVLGGTGPDRGRYIISQNGERDGEYIWESTDDQGHFVIQDIVAKAAALKAGEIATARYAWRNPGDRAARWKIARLAYYKPWDWVIGTSVYEDELQMYRTVLSDGRSRMTSSMALAGCGIVLLVGLIGVFVAHTITRPIRRITFAVETIIDGDLNQRLEIDSRDELGVLARTFDTMTERLRRTIATLNKSEEKYRRFVDTANEGVWALGAGHRTEFVNTRMAEMLGTRVEDMLGKRFQDFMFEDDWSDHERRMAVRERGVAEHYERRFRGRDGRVIWTLISASPLIGADGGFQGSFGMLTDITELKRREETIRISLTEKEVLLKEIHHRVKNNLQIIISLLNLLGYEYDSPPITRILKEIHGRIMSMALVHEVLYSSTSLSAVDFSTYVERFCANLFSSYGVKSDKIGFSCRIDGLALGLDQAIPCGLIINELVSNSLKYALPGERRGTIRVEMSIDAQETIILRVSDDGVGLPPAFDAAHSPTLGMRLVHGLVGQLGGLIERESGAGTAFRIEFKLKRA